MRRARILLFLFGVTACDSTSNRAMTVTETDGVRTATNADSPRLFASVVEPAEFSIGGPDESGPALFFQIDRLLVDATGRVWVADGRSGELRIFHADGSHWKTLGGSGDGPGEFRRIRLLGSFRGDSIAVGDRGLRRVTLFTPEGEMAGVRSLGSVTDPTATAHRVFEDGAVLAQVPRLLSAASLSPGQILGDTARFVRIEPDGTRTPLAEIPGPRWLWTGRSQVSMPFTASPAIAVSGNALHASFGPSFRVVVFGSDGLAEAYEVDRSPERVTEADVASRRAMLEELAPGQQRSDYLDALTHEALPSVLPGYVQLVVDDEANIWAQRFSPETSWDVFSPERAFLGHVAVPDNFQVWDVANGRVAGVYRDELGVEYVRVYRLRGGGSP